MISPICPCVPPPVVVGSVAAFASFRVDFRISVSNRFEKEI